MESSATSSISPNRLHLTAQLSLYTVPTMASGKSRDLSNPIAGNGVLIDRIEDVLTFTLDNSSHGNEVTGPMFDAMLAELLAEARKPRARVLRMRARGTLFCTG